jgi:FkbM family methyltransferase
MNFISTLKNSIRPYLFYSYFLRNRILPRKTYAQHSEDLVIEKILGTVESFIDIGANNGFSVSNTFLFSLRGAKGLLFEPVYLTFSDLNKLYRFNSHCICIQEGLSNEYKILQIQREGLLSYIPETLNSSISNLLDKYYSKSVNLEEIVVRPLSYWINKYSDFSRCDFVSLDVEGHELSVLQGIDFSVFQTKCFVIETNGFERPDYEEISSLLNLNFYKPLLFNDLNTFWFSSELLDNSIFLDNLKQIPKTFPEYQLMC